MARSTRQRIGAKLGQYLRSQAIPITLSLGIVVVAVLVLSAQLPVLYDVQQRVENVAYDARMRMTLPAKVEPDPTVVIVTIDEKSLAAEGQWPWPRSLIAALVDKITAAGATVIAFDTVYAEPERNIATDLIAATGDQIDPQVKDYLAQLVPLVDQDTILATSLAQSMAVLGFTFSGDEGTAQGALPAPTVVYKGDPNKATFLNMPAFVGNVELLAANSTTSGFFTVLPDSDGVIRRVPTVIRHGDTLYASLAVEAVRLTLGADSIEVFTKPVGDEERVDHVSIGGMIDLPTDGYGQLMVPFKGHSPAFNYVSATDVLHDAAPAGAMEGSIVLVGITAAGLHDLRATPVQTVYPGVEVHATLMSAMLGEGFPVTPSWALGADVAIVLLFGIAAAFLLPRLSPFVMLLIALVIVGGIIAFNAWMWQEKKLVLSLATPVLAISGIAFINVAFGFLNESRSRRMLRDSFGQYVPPSLVEQMYADPDKEYGLEGESRELSVLFSDIRGFTSISEALEPQALKQMLNEYFTPITEIIFRHNGTIDKYVGDMVMAFWGAPVRDAEHRLHAIVAGLEMLDTLPRLAVDFAARGWPRIEIGIGINSGPMNVGDMGSSFRRAYTVIGDAVNLGSRLESLTKHYGVPFLVSESAIEGVSGIVFRRLDRITVKGKSEPVTIYQPVCRAEQETDALRAELAAHAAALELYFAGDWDPALQAFEALIAQHPDSRCYHVYLDHIAELRVSHPDGGWNGVYDHHSK